MTDNNVYDQFDGNSAEAEFVFENTETGFFDRFKSHVKDGLRFSSTSWLARKAAVATVGLSNFEEEDRQQYLQSVKEEKFHFENMDPAKGIGGYTAAVAGQVIGGLPAAENFVPIMRVPGLDKVLGQGAQRVVNFGS